MDSFFSKSSYLCGIPWAAVMNWVLLPFTIWIQTGELVWFPLLLVYIHKGHETWYGTGM